MHIEEVVQKFLTKTGDIAPEKDFLPGVIVPIKQ